MSDLISGFTVPLHRSLTEPILVGGAPRSAAILTGTLAAAVGLGLQQWIPGLLLWAAGHCMFVRLAKLDPDLMPVLSRHLRHKGYLAC